MQATHPAPPRAPQLVVASTQQRLINQDRASAGLPPLAWNSCLAAIATQNALRMATQGYISHANGVTLDLGCHVGSRAGENIGYLSAGINDVEMNAMFMASAEHRANILGPYHYVATAWVVAPN
ncbi:MAG TPA: CAP domain-containing protein, partial [Pseudonocardiaceae bacterium]|nr:CAP domain-containing protein [Pseudonocardiaceae bacterium]